MKLLVISNGLWLSGAQVSANEFLRYIGGEAVVKVLSCTEGKYIYIPPKAEVHRVPCGKIGNLVTMDLDSIAERFIKWADVVWIATSEFRLAPSIKKIRRVPIIAHLHSYEFICPYMYLPCGYKNVCTYGCCTYGCSTYGCSMRKIVDCKQNMILEMSKLGVLPGIHKITHLATSFLTAPIDYIRWRLNMKEVIESIDFFIAVSKFVRDIYLEYFPGIESNIEVIYNPGALRPWRYVNSFPEREPYIIYAGGANIIKGPHILLQAFNLLHKDLDIELYMLGVSGSWVENYVNRFGIKRVKLLGKLFGYKFFNMLARARATIVPSITPETGSLIAIESISLGVPVIGSNRGALPEIIEGYGIVTEPKPENLSYAISIIMKREYNRDEMRKYSEQKFGKNNVEQFLKTINDAF